MDVYGQDPEVDLLRSLLPRLEQPTFVDVGAEQGSFAEALLSAGIERLYAFDPHPANASALRARFASDRRVHVFEYALSSRDGSGELHVSSHPDGEPIAFGHTLLERPDAAEIAWRESVAVEKRSLASLVESGDVPERAGILKIDTEGHDLEVMRGIGRLQAEVVMVEHWTDLPNSLGACPWTSEEMVATLRDHGYGHFAFIVHRGELVTMKWDDADVERGAMGNLVFLHDEAVNRLLPAVLDCASSLAERSVGVAQGYMRAASDRRAMVDELKQIADERLLMIEEVKQAADERLLVLEEVDRIARERLERIRELEREPPDLEASRA